MSEYEAKLTNDQWLGGQQPGAADREALEAMTAPPDVKQFPHTFAWWCLASKFTPSVRASWTGGAAKTAAKPAAGKKAEEKKPAAKEDDMDDLFGEETEADKAAAAEAKKKAEAEKAKKVKAAPVAKSIIVWEVKPYRSDIDLDYLGKRILGIKMDGLAWKSEFKKEPVAFGVFKLIIGAVVEDLKVSTD